MKKIISILLICAIFTGCSARKEYSDNSAVEEPSVSETESTSTETSSSASEPISEPPSAVSSSISETSSAADKGNGTSTVSSSSAESTSSVESSSVNDTTSDADNTSNKEDTSSASSTASTTSTTPVTSVPVVEKPTWTEEEISSTVLYVNKANIYSRKDAVVGSTAVKKYGLNDKVSVVAKTNTDYYKLEDGTFIHKDYLSTKETVVTPTAPPASTVSVNAEKLLNNAKLNPMMTNYDELDALVSDVLGRITNDGMTTYQKVVAIYDYIVKTFKYGVPEQDYTTELNYHMMLDSAIAPAAYTLLVEKVGVCNDYSSLFLVMTRRIGLECYLVSGQVPSRAGGTTGHTWTIIKLDGKYYTFDPQIEQSNLVNGQIAYKFFCKEEFSMPEFYTYGLSSYFRMCQSFYPDEPKTVDNIRDFMILFFGDFVIDEGERPYWTLVF